MKKITALCIAVLAVVCGLEAQVTCSNASHRTLTSYTNGMANDSLFFICQNQTATLVATPPSGTPGWDFVWQQFNVAGNSWNALATVPGVPISEQSNLQPGGYRVVITDGTNTIVGTYIVWVCRINTPPSVSMNPIAAGCGSVQLTGQINAGTITPYYNPPSLITDPNNTLIVNSETEITVCFSGTHTYVSDLGFYLVGPASCGSPTILLSPNPGAVCNSNNNFTNLCFSTESTALFNQCNPIGGTGNTSNYTGTYGGYTNPTSNFINWAGLMGCNASEAGWSVQVYDCTPIDIGTLTDATISFNGTSAGGSPISYTYTTPAGFSSAIGDNSCSPATASIFTVPAAPAVVINFPTTYEWTADPPFNIPNSTSGLNKTLNPGPTVDTQFTLSLTGTHPGAVCGGTSSDTEFFDYIPPTTPTIQPVNTSYCTLDGDFNLMADINGGSWSGTGITSSSAGTFSPSAAGVGSHTVTYALGGTCTLPATIIIEVTAEPQVNITPVNPLCSNADPIALSASPAGGTWSGPGISDGSLGTFNPSTAGNGIHEITYEVGGACAASGTANIEVTLFVPLTITAPNSVCINENTVTLTATPTGGTWTGDGITSQGVFSPGVAGLGVHSVTYSIVGNCAQSSSVSINVTGETTVNIQPVQPVCSNANPFNLAADMTGGTWSGTGITNPTAGTFNPTTAGIGEHTINYVVSGLCPATGSITITVNEFEEPVITAPSALCVEANPTTFSATPTGGTWSGTGITPEGVFTASVSGVGTATVTYNIGGSCPGTATHNIQINPMPNVSAGSDVAICQGGSVVLTATGASSYLWSPSASLSSNSVASPTATPSVTTTYTVTGTTNACSFSDQVVVTVNAAANVVVNGPFVICLGDSVQLVASGLANYSWNNAASLTSSSIANPFAFPNSNVTYTVSGTNSGGCQGSATIDVTVLQANFTYSPHEGLVPLEVEFVNLSQGSQFFWDFGNGDSETTFDPSINVSSIYYEQGLFTATLTTVNGGTTCSHSATVLVYSDSEIIMIPNIVTNDNNIKNDNFVINSIAMKEMDVQIFDRWGKSVGSIDSPTGSWNPRDYPEGTYYYVLKAEGLDGVKHDRSGYFMVVR